MPKDKIRRGFEMMRASRRILTERDTERREKKEREKVVTKDGRVVNLLPHHVEMLKDKKGLHAVGRGGRSTAQHFGMSQAFGQYRQGPEGLWFVWNGGWEPTSLWRNGAQSPQQDPDGNVRIEKNGEWYLEDEVA